jgi:hypothetical protein
MFKVEYFRNIKCNDDYGGDGGGGGGCTMPG